MKTKKALKLAALAFLAIAQAGMASTTSNAAFFHTKTVLEQSGADLVTRVGSYDRTIPGGYFESRDGSGLYNQVRMTNRDTLQVRRYVNGRTGPWSTFHRISSDTFRSSAGANYVIKSPNTVVFNNFRALHRVDPIPQTPDYGNPGQGCVSVGSGFQICFGS